MGKSKKKQEVSGIAESPQNKIKNKKSSKKAPGGGSKVWLALAILAACIVGFIHGVHISTMFEKDRHFSHLSSLERDLTFRTEMGLYYSYYKSIVNANSLFDGIHEIVRDNITEFPSTINVLKRFNLYPELILGASYRIYDTFTKYMKYKTKECWQINRGNNLPPVESCEGFGDQHYFYITNIFFLNGIMMSFVFLYAWYLSGESLWGGVIAVAFYFFNHGEATRVMWTPPLRESFSFPFLIVELAMVTYTLKQDRPTTKHGALVGIAAFCFTLPWQFAQFALLTQVTALFALYLLEFIGSYKIKLFIYAHTASLLCNFVFQFGNEMLLTSFFASSLLVMLAVVYCENGIESRVQNLIARCFCKGLIWIVGTFGMKKAISSVLSIADDAHIWDILRSKFTDYANFHTMLYTCAKEFDFIEMKTIISISKTLLLPSCVIVCVIAAIRFLKYEYDAYMASCNENVTNVEETNKAYRSKPNAEILYNILQMLAFTFIAVMLMRLKLFMTPIMCIVASLLAHRQLMPFKDDRMRQLSVIIVILGVSCVNGITNLREQLTIMGEFENYPHEQLLDFINLKLPKNAVFAGAMPTMASIKLSCNRAIVNHPHYEDAGLRDRTHEVYKMYSRKPLKEVHEIVKKMRVTHYILEDSWCTRRAKAGCLMAEIYDLEDVENRGKSTACGQAKIDPSPYFTVVFKNDVYTILQVNNVARMKKN